jgi:hypothetical protein
MSALRTIRNVEALIVLMVLPLLGAAFTNRDLGALFQFPPRQEIPAAYQHFSWAGAGLVLTVLALMGTSCISAMTRAKTRFAVPSAQSRKSVKFPLWGWLAGGWTLIWWMFAWTRWSWFEGFQRFTFFPSGLVSSFTSTPQPSREQEPA